MSAKSTSSLNWDSFFRTKLKEISESTRELVKLGEPIEQHIQELQNMAEDFFKNFEHSPIPVRGPNPKLDYSSIMVSTSVLLPYGFISVPFFFLDIFLDDVSYSFEEEFQQNVKWIELVGLICQKWYYLNRKKLTKTMVLICKTLSRYGVQGQIYRFPLSQEIIANRTRQSLSIVKISIPQVYSMGIVRNFFLLNPWKLGWNLHLLIYTYSPNDFFSDLDNLTIAVEICSNNKMFRVIQQPMLDSGERLASISKKLKQINGSIHSIEAIDFHWDLSQLEPQENRSFRKAPNFFAKSPLAIESNIHFELDSNVLDWIANSKSIKDLIIGNVGEPSGKSGNVKILSDLKISRIMDVLNYLVEYEIPLVNYENTAEKIGIPVYELSEIIQFLIENRVIALASRFKSIGAGREYAFIIEDSNKELNEFIKQKLLQCVFSYFYESEKMIAGRVQVPDNWVANFLEFFTRLQFANPELRISYGQRLLGFSLFVPNIHLPKNYVLNEFGTKLETTTT